MRRIKNILVCLDLSEMDDFLINYSNYIIRTFKPETMVFIHVMEVYSLPDEFAGSFDGTEGDLKDMVREELYEKIRNGISENGDTRISLIIETGLTAEKLLQYIRKNKVDITILGKKIGYHGEGSVARRIVGLVPSSVLVISETSREEINKILVRMDFSSMSASTLDMAREIAGYTGAMIEFHHVYKLPLYYYPRQTPENIKKMNAQLAELVAEEYSKFIKKMKIKEPPPVTYSLETQIDESQLLYDHARRNGFDLILTGTRIKSSLGGLILDKTSEKLVGSDQNIPVMVVKDPKQSAGILKAIFD